MIPTCSEEYLNMVHLRFTVNNMLPPYLLIDYNEIKRSNMDFFIYILIIFVGGHGMIIPNLNPSCEQKEGKVLWVRTTLSKVVVLCSTKANSVEISIYVIFY